MPLPSRMPAEVTAVIRGSEAATWSWTRAVSSASPWLEPSAVNSVTTGSWRSVLSGLPGLLSGLPGLRATMSGAALLVSTVGELRWLETIPIVSAAAPTTTRPAASFKPALSRERGAGSGNDTTGICAVSALACAACMAAISDGWRQRRSSG